MSRPEVETVMARKAQRIAAESLAGSFQTADFPQNAVYDPERS